MDEYKRKLDSVKNERRRAEKNVQEVVMKLRLGSLIVMLPFINRRNMLIFMSWLTSFTWCYFIENLFLLLKASRSSGRVSGGR